MWGEWRREVERMNLEKKERNGKRGIEREEEEMYKKNCWTDCDFPQ